MTFEDAVWLAVDNLLGLAVVGTLMWVIYSEIHPAIGCLALVAASVLGGLRRSLWTALLLAVGATTLNLAVSHFRWMSSHVGQGLIWEGLTVAGLLLGAFAIICGVAWGVGRLATRLVRGEMPAQTQ